MGRRRVAQPRGQRPARPIAAVRTGSRAGAGHSSAIASSDAPEASPQPATRSGIEEASPGSDTGRMNASSSVVVDAASTELTTPANSTPKPTTAIAGAASQVGGASVASEMSTPQATASAAWARSRSRIGPRKSTSSNIANDPNAANVATSGLPITSPPSANIAGMTTPRDPPAERREPAVVLAQPREAGPRRSEDMRRAYRRSGRAVIALPDRAGPGAGGTTHVVGPSGCPRSCSARCCATSARRGDRVGRDRRAVRGRGARHREPTFRVGGHHYALVCVEGLEPGSHDAVRGAPRRRAPLAAAGRRFPPASSARPAGRGRCGWRSARAASRVPHEPPYTLSKDEDDARPRGRRAARARTAHADRADRGVARRAAAPRRPGLRRRGLAGDARAHPRAAATPSAGRRARRSPTSRSTAALPRGVERPAMRWLLSIVPSAMIFDDHDMLDDWNISAAWVEDMRAQPWWRSAIVGALHVVLDLPAPRQPVARRARRGRRLRAGPSGDDDAEQLLRACARRPTRRVAGTPLELPPRLRRHPRSWSRLPRGPRARPTGAAQMVAEEEWAWVVEALHRRLRPPADRHDAALCCCRRASTTWRPGTRRSATAPGAARRRGWARRSAGPRPRALGGVPALVRAACGAAARVGAGGRGAPPASIVLLRRRAPRLPRRGALPARGGVAERRRPGGVLADAQPARPPRAARAARRAVAHGRRPCAGLLARARGRPRAGGALALPEAPTFDNQVATLSLDGRAARLVIERTDPDEWRDPQLHVSLDRVIVPPSDGGRVRGWVDGRPG